MGGLFAVPLKHSPVPGSAFVTVRDLTDYGDSR